MAGLRQQGGWGVFRLRHLGEIGQTVLLGKRVETGQGGARNPALQLHQRVVIEGHAAGLLPRLGVLGPGEVFGEQKHPATERFVLGLHVLQGGAGVIELALHIPMGLGPHMGTGYGQECLIGFLLGDQGVIPMGGGFVQQLPGQAKTAKGTTKCGGLGVGHPVEPEEIARQAILIGKAEVSPGFQFIQSLAQGQHPILGLLLALPVGQGLSHDTVEIKRGIHPCLMAPPPHIHQIAQGLAGVFAGP